MAVGTYVTLKGWAGQEWFPEEVVLWAETYVWKEGTWGRATEQHSRKERTASATL